MTSRHHAARPGPAGSGSTATEEVRSFLRWTNDQLRSATSKRGAAAANVALPGGAKIRVIDSIAEDGAKLIEISPGQMMKLRAAHPSLKLVPIVHYYPQRQREKIGSKSAAATATKIRLTVVSKQDGSPVAGAMVVAFTDFQNRVGAGGTTSGTGVVDLALGAMSKKLERISSTPRGVFGPSSGRTSPSRQETRSPCCRWISRSRTPCVISTANRRMMPAGRSRSA